MTKRRRDPGPALPASGPAGVSPTSDPGPTLTRLEALVQRAEAVAERLDTAVRAGNGTVGDLRRAAADAEAQFKELAADEIQKSVASQMDKLNEAVADTRDEITDAMFKRFDKIYAMLMGQNKVRKYDEELTVPELLLIRRLIQEYRREEYEGSFRATPDPQLAGPTTDDNGNKHPGASG